MAQCRRELLQRSYRWLSHITLCTTVSAVLSQLLIRTKDARAKVER